MDLFLRRPFIIHKKKLPKEIQLRFLKRLHRLLENGYPLLEAMETMKWDKSLQPIATHIITSLQNGMTIDRAFEKARFHQAITNYLYFVQANGDLQGSIMKSIEMFEQRMNYTKKFQQMARYPLILFIIFSLLLLFIKQSVLPSFMEMFQSNTNASSIIVISIILIDLFMTGLIAIGILGMIVFATWHLMKHRISIVHQIKIYQSIPIYRSFIKAQTSYFFALHFSSLLKTGMSFKEILQHMANQQKIPIITYYATLISAELSRGLHITYLLSQFTLFEEQLVSIFQKNADTSALEKDLSVYGDLLMEDIEDKLMKFITFLQPVFFILLALFIVFIYVTLMWPMFELINTI
ncbi:competence type IV pilus assembly protein ComGB [Oceanobacillus chungangensis]|uniref:Chromosome partitioning protein ParA n=1 Tax=Oceanobacillus chungangensis TaxID=1229152 RepID=A0A3D8Q3T6_9BACI|nr:competence type IV pilus assembly protein ComGB [Oceanobacillus chungangensis]RDW21935.1 chromosome partitioning protein ParA [Oceanobacillus chungangensis]